MRKSIGRRAGFLTADLTLIWNYTGSIMYLVSATALWMPKKVMEPNHQETGVRKSSRSLYATEEPAATSASRTVSVA